MLTYNNISVLRVAFRKRFIRRKVNKSNYHFSDFKLFVERLNTYIRVYLFFYTPLYITASIKL